MAMLEIDVISGAFATVHAVAVTALQIIAPSTNKVRAGGVGPPDAKRFIEISFPDTAITDGAARVRILRQTTAIGGSPTTVTPVKHRNGDAGTIQTTAKKSAGGSEPTASDVYYDSYHPQQGRQIIPGSYCIEQGDRLGVEITTAVSDINVSVNIPCEE
jgi:hypothetical protein